MEIKVLLLLLLLLVSLRGRENSEAESLTDTYASGAAPAAKAAKPAKAAKADGTQGAATAGKSRRHGFIVEFERSLILTQEEPPQARTRMGRRPVTRRVLLRRERARG